MASRKVECQFVQTPMVPPDIHDYRKGVTASLQKIYGAVGASKFVWRVALLDEAFDTANTLRLILTLDDPSDKVWRDRFFAAVATTRVVANDRVVVRVLDHT